MTEEEEIISGAEEEEEEEIWEDNTLNRDDIINATAQSFEDIEDYIDNLDISAPEAASVDWDDPDQISEQILVTIDATKLIYNTKKYRLEAYATKGKALHDAYLEQFMAIINESTEATASVLEEYDKLWEEYLATNPSDEEKTTKLAEFNQLKTAAVLEADPDKKQYTSALNDAYLEASSAMLE